MVFSTHIFKNIADENNIKRTQIEKRKKDAEGRKSVHKRERKDGSARKR